LVNGRGAINGTGMVNGTGMINGTKGEARLSVRDRQRLFVTRWQFLAILIAIVIVVPTFIYLSYSRESTPFVVDGKFDEWSHADKFSAYVSSGSASTDIHEWAIDIQEDRLFMYVQVEGTLMSSAEVNSFFMFIDADNIPTTGYSVSGIGAEYLLEIDGWNGSVQSTSVSEYASGADVYDWNSWANLGSLGSSAVGSQLEAMASMPVTLAYSSRFMLMSQNNLEQRSISYTVPARGGLLVIEQEQGVGIGTDGLANQSTNTTILRLRLTCDGVGGTVRSISSSFVSAPLASPIANIQLDPGEEQIVDVAVDTTGVVAGSTVSAHMMKSAIDSTFSDVEILGEGVTAYVGAAPASIVIDGAFGDWVNRTTVDSDSVPCANPNIDINAVGAVNDTSASYFYVSVHGNMCSGSYVPIIREKPSGGGGGGGIVIPTRKTGEDILNIYIDSDMNASSGDPVSISSKLIGADHKIEIRGLNGDVISRSLLVYSTGHWSYGSGFILAANDMQRIEVSVSSSSLNGASSIDYIIETTDWRGRADMATSVPQGTRALTGGMIPSAGFESWRVDGSTNSGLATAMSYQRKLFYDGLNYWSFYFDGSNTLYRYSTDFGQNWSLAAQAFSVVGIGEASVWYDSVTSTVYIVGDNSTVSSSTVHVRKGTVIKSPSPSISWSSGDQTPSVSSVALAGKNTYISSDSSGFLWILTSNQTTTGTYDLSAFRSRTANTTTSSEWFCTGNMIEPDVTLPNIKGSVVPASGGAMWSVYAYEGNVGSRKYSAGAWTPTEMLIYDISTDSPNDRNPANTDLAPPSVVVDSKDVVHVLFGDGHEKTGIGGGPIPHAQYSYYGSGGVWVTTLIGSSKPASVGNMYTTISLDQATGNVFAFWIETDPGGTYHSIICKKNVTGTWTAISLSSDTTYVKQYLTSIYSAPNEQLICWQWTQNTTSTIEVQFDKIPEFKDVIVPVVLMLGMFTAIIGRGRALKRRDRDA